MKRLFKKIAVISLAASCLIFGLTLTGCSGKQDAKAFETSQDVYSFASATTVQMLDKAVSAEESLTAAVMESAVSDEQLVDTLDKYMAIFQSIVGNEKPTENQVLPSDKEGYALKIITTLPDIGGGTKSYVFYYNETVPSEDNRPADDDDDEISTRLEGIMTIGENQYALTGEKTVEDGEVEISLKAQADNYSVEFEQETENDEQEFSYKLYKDGNLADSLELEVEIEDDETELEMFTATADGAEVGFKIEKSGDNTFEIEYTEGDTTGKINVSVQQKDGSVVYKYTVDDDSEFERIDD